MPETRSLITPGSGRVAKAYIENILRLPTIPTAIHTRCLVAKAYIEKILRLEPLHAGNRSCMRRIPEQSRRTGRSGGAAFKSCACQGPPSRAAIQKKRPSKPARQENDRRRRAALHARFWREWMPPQSRRRNAAARAAGRQRAGYERSTPAASAPRNSAAPPAVKALDSTSDLSSALL